MTIRMLLIIAVLGVIRPVAAGEWDSTRFDRVERSAYADLLRDAASAYAAGHYEDSFIKFRRTACAGDKQSQSALGRMYLLGQGTRRDDLTGYAWLKLAAEVIYPKYQSVVRALEEAMTPEQRMIADDRVTLFRERYSLGPTGMSCSLSASKGGHIVDRIVCTPRSEGRRVLLRRCEDVPKN